MWPPWASGLVLILPAIRQAATAALQPVPAACNVAIAGGGWAGVYFAFRMAEAGEQVCIFEATQRLGGRTYSHSFRVGSRRENFTLDVGAYRFSPDMHLPGDVILNVLQLPTACYEPDCEPANKDFPPPFMFNYTAALRRIVDAEGMPAGYVTAINSLVAKILELGGKVFTGMRLTDLQPTDAGAVLIFNNVTVDAKQVLLNLPRGSLLSLPTLAAATPRRTAAIQACVKFDLPPGFFPQGHFHMGRALTKAYAFYEEAWWHTRLNRTTGQWPANAFSPIDTSQGIPIGIHFNDGPVRCDAPGKGCRGFLQMFYSMCDADFFNSLRPDPEHPMGVLRAQDDGAGKLAKLHAAILEATGPLFIKARAELPISAPTMLVVGVWDRTGQGLTAPTKVYYSTSAKLPGGPDPLARACGVPGLTEEEYQHSMLAPLEGSSRVLVANNDWSALQTEKLFGDWAEESLLQAERGLRLLGLPRPEWLNEAYYAAKVSGTAATAGRAWKEWKPRPEELVV
mmetsp:Transcript_99094/g.275932  ORF Transcript_99094/g.275932 Transcript_99094/m.275932 type:complete len:511 (-) Transcript_99094:82-1614(-)